MFETTNQIFSSTPSCCAGIFALHDLRLHRIRSRDQHHRNATRTGLTSAHRRHEPIRIPWEVRMGVIAPIAQSIFMDQWMSGDGSIHWRPWDALGLRNMIPHDTWCWFLVCLRSFGRWHRNLITRPASLIRMWRLGCKFKMEEGRSGSLKNREPIQFPKLWRLRVRSKPGEALPNVKSHFPRIDAIWLPYASLEASGSTFDISPGYQISPQFPTGCSRSKIPVLSGDSNWPGR